MYEWLRQNKPTIKESEYICLPCVKQIQRYHDKPNFIPRWIPNSSMQKKKCSIERCQAELHTHTLLASVEQIEMILNDRVNTFTISSSSQSVALCREHYAQVCIHTLASCYTMRFMWRETEKRRSIQKVLPLPCCSEWLSQPYLN